MSYFTPTYKCDPAKHASCNKRNCYLNGGSCNRTLNKEYELEEVSMKQMLEMQKQLQKFLGTDFEDMSMEERTAFIKEHSIHLTQEIHEALYELPFFKPWKDYENMTVEEMAEQIKKYKAEMVDAFHFFMNMMLAVDFTAEEFELMYLEKNEENFERQRRGYTHDVSYREEQ